MTAGHCIVNGDHSTHGRYYSNVVFVPDWHGGSNLPSSPQTACAVSRNACPLGLWTARWLDSTVGWLRHRALKYDFGVIVLNRNSRGQTIQALLGGQPMAWNQNRRQHFAAFGWPSEQPFNGSKLIECKGSTARSDGSGPQAEVGIGCGMAGGSSGGGWFISWGSGGGYRDGHNDYTYGSQKIMYSPYYGQAPVNLFYKARAV